METKIIHIEMDCIHDHVEKTMTCSWLNGEIKMIVHWTTGQLGVMHGDKVKAVYDVKGMSIDEFMHIQELCQAAATSLAVFDEMAA